MSSSFIKTALVSYLRFAKGAKQVATEAGEFSSDVLAIKKKELYEFEVKVSKADLKADFKKPKHRKYQTKYLTPTQAKHVPNYFYFAVPPELAEFALQQNLTTPYGVAVVHTGQFWKRRRQWFYYGSHRDEMLQRITDNPDKLKLIEIENNLSSVRYVQQRSCHITYESWEDPAMEERVRIIKRAKKLHNFEPHEATNHQLNARASSELANLRVKYHWAKEKLEKLGIKIEK